MRVRLLRGRTWCLRRFLAAATRSSTPQTTPRRPSRCGPVVSLSQAYPVGLAGQLGTVTRVSVRAGLGGDRVAGTLSLALVEPMLSREHEVHADQLPCTATFTSSPATTSESDRTRVFRDLSCDDRAPGVRHALFFGWTTGLARARSNASTTLIDFFDGLDGEQQQGIERARALTRFAIAAVAAHVAVEAFDVGVDSSTSSCMSDLDDFLQMEFDSAAFAVGCAGRASRGTVKTMRAHVFANSRHVFIQLSLCVHHTPPFPAPVRCRIVNQLRLTCKCDASRTTADSPVNSCGK